ncbi:DNA-directed RNA polymerase III, subunit Rpc31 [Rhodotorula diobovata]|uniref:DNA-directed RNA polymerase III subunit n=1 Tax=Rhodotorula diobovata TaxID=5288 RepID=A0A5C5G2C5_9BASI|nr:DNA-directed RNA polymerase III, subunit Rpc31 [Rhodotorula diobovata]
MSGRGGRGGGRGGRGGSGKPQAPIGHLQYADIIATSKEGTDVLYPPMDMPDTEYPSTREASIARRYNAMVGDMKFTPFWIDAPARASTDIERYSDQFKPKAATSDKDKATNALRTVHSLRVYDRDLLPPSIFEAVLEKKLKTKGSSKAVRKTTDANILAGDDDQAVEEDEEQSEQEDELLEEEDEEDEDNDYEAEYFDNGENDDFDDLGGGGGGGDDEGGIMD